MKYNMGEMQPVNVRPIWQTARKSLRWMPDKMKNEMEKKKNEQSDTVILIWGPHFICTLNCTTDQACCVGLITFKTKFRSSLFFIWFFKLMYKCVVKRKWKVQVYFIILLVKASPDLGNMSHAALWFGPFLGSVPHECNLDECSSLAFGLINNNINSNYCDRLINSFKNAAQRKRREQIFSGDNNFYGIIVDIISNFMFQNTTEIIKNFFLSYFTLFYYSDCSCSSFLFR